MNYNGFSMLKSVTKHKQKRDLAIIKL